MGTLQILDVRIIEPKLKYSTIFKTFDGLQKNKSIIIINNHNLKHLYYKFLAKKPCKFSWQYLKEGPVEWRVKISKKPIKEKTIGQLAAEDYKKALLFKRLNIDFCCDGRKTLQEVVQGKGLDIKMVENEILSIPKNTSEKNIDFINMNLRELINHIIDFHHEYLRKTLPELIEILHKVVNIYSNRHPELVNMSKSFINMSSELLALMEKEEAILFPYINSLGNIKPKNSKQITLPQTITDLENEYKNIFSNLRKIRELTNGYKIPAGACESFTILYISLKEFEQDLEQQMHLENNILFPKAIGLEASNFRIRQ